MNTRGATMVEYAMLLVATSLVALCFLRVGAQRAGFSAERAASVLSTAHERSAAPPTGETIEEVGRMPRAGVSR